MLVALKGHPGCGKSRLGRSLGKALGWPVLDKDDVRDCTFSLQHDHHVPAPVLNSFSYQALWRLVDTQLEMGLSVIVDCPLSRPNLFLSAVSLSHCHSVRLVIIECVASDLAEWKRRLEGRVAADCLVSMTSDDHPGSSEETLGSMMRDAAEAQGLPADGAEMEASSGGGDSCSSALPHDVAPSDQGVSKESGQETCNVKVDDDSRATGKSGTAIEGVAPTRKYSKGWHKPGSWEGVQKLLQEYGNCWDYDMSAASACKKLVIDTTSSQYETLVAGVLRWIEAVSDDTPAVTYLELTTPP